MTRPRQRSTREKLDIARAQLRAVNTVTARMTWSPPAFDATGANGGPPRFLQVCTVRRGYADILHALDETGQVWELKTTLGEKIAGQQRTVLDSWWEKIGMVRR